MTAMPNIHINLKKYAHNLSFITQEAKKHGVSIMAVSKVFCADQRLIDVINASDICYIADSKLIHLEHMHTEKPKVFLRIASEHEALDVCKYANLSLQSELKTIRALNEKAKALYTKHQIILMFDLGDLREGIYYQDAYLNIVEEILSMEHIILEGIGTNLTCYGGVIPDQKTYDKLKKIKDDIEMKFHLKLNVMSGGNSSSIKMLMQQELPPWINNLRIGEALVLGRETAYQMPIKGMYDDVFMLEAEIVELKDKPSKPEGELGKDAFGEDVTFVDQGVITRAILNVGRQDVHCKDLIPPDGVEILGCSSDHLIVKVKKDAFQLGGTIRFKLSYGGILSLMTSPYVGKVYHDTL